MAGSPALPAAEPLAHATHSDGTRRSADDLVREAMPLVGYVVTELLSRLPAHVRRDELESAGYEALVRCAASYDPAVGTSFAQYARIRVRGAVVDELRSTDWASRSARRAERDLSAAEERLTQQLGRRPDEREVAAELGTDRDEMHRTRERVQRAAVLSLNAIVGDGDVDLVTGLPAREAGPEERLVADERSSTLQAAVAALPERLRIVVQGYFFGERPMAELARELGVSESRISQMRAQALELLREGMTRALDDNETPAARPAPADAPVAVRRREEYYARVAALAGASGRQSVGQQAFTAFAANAASTTETERRPAYTSVLA